MICYYKIQINEDEHWKDDPTNRFPMAVKQVQAHDLIEDLDLSDDRRFIRIKEFDIQNQEGEIIRLFRPIIWLNKDQFGFWHDILMSTDTKPNNF